MTQLQRIVVRSLRASLLILIALSGIATLQSNDWAVLASPDSQFLRVAISGSDTASCGSESTPCQSIQYAANKAASGDILLVAGGTYTYKASADNCTFLTTRAVVCFVDKNLAILGGYALGNWANPDPLANPTVIDGGNSRRGVAIIAYNSTANLRMEGFTIQNGLAQGTSSGEDFYTFAFGGGMWAQNSSVTLRNLTFRNNRSVGGTTSSQYGGSGSGAGLAIQSTKNGVASTLDHLLFDSNQAVGGSGTRRGGFAIGGGLYTYGSKLVGTNLQFNNNSVQAGSSAGSGQDTIAGERADAIGGAAGFEMGSDITLSGIEATNNKAKGGNAGAASGSVAGGAFGGAIGAEHSNISLGTGTLVGNNATGGNSATGGSAMGGAILTDASFVTIYSTKIINNIAISGASLNGGNAGSPGGGGVYLASFSGAGYTAQIVNTIIADNQIELGNPGTSVGGGGGGLMVQAVVADIIHSTFANNKFVGNLNFGQAIAANGSQGPGGVPATANIKYSIIADHVNSVTNNTSALTVAQGSTANINRVLFAGNTNDTNLNNRPVAVGTITGMNTVISANPVRFVSPGAPGYEYHLLPNSPAIDQAVGSTTTIDIDGDTRPIGSYPDLGADEAQQSVTGASFYLYLPLTKK